MATSDTVVYMLDASYPWNQGENVACHPWDQGDNAACYYSHGAWPNDIVYCGPQEIVQYVPMCTASKMDDFSRSDNIPNPFPMEFQTVGVQGCADPNVISTCKASQRCGMMQSNAQGAKKTTSQQRRQRRSRAAAKARAGICAGKAYTQHANVCQDVLAYGNMQQENLDHCSAEVVPIKADGENLQAIIDAVRGSVVAKSLDPHWCRIVQDALHGGGKASAALLASELHGNVWTCMDSPHGNYVLQKVVEVLPAVHCSFIAVELQGLGKHAAQHKFGCRILCRLFEHAASEDAVAALINELATNAGELCRHKYGHYVGKHLFEHGCDGHKKLMARALRSNLLRLARHRYASEVVTEALRQCDDEDKFALADILLDGLSNASHMVDCPFHRNVLQELYALGDRRAEIVQTRLQQNAESLSTSKAGRKALSEFGIRLGGA